MSPYAMPSYILYIKNSFLLAENILPYFQKALKNNINSSSLILTFGAGNVLELPILKRQINNTNFQTILPVALPPNKNS